MTEERAALAQALAAAERLAESLALSLEDLRGIGSLDADVLAGLDRQQQKDVLAFLKAFEQFQDMLSRRVLRLCLILGGDDVSGLTARAAFDRAESLGVLTDAAAFFDAQAVRHRLAHEYAMSDAKRVERLRAAIGSAEVLLREYKVIAGYARPLSEVGA